MRSSLKRIYKKDFSSMHHNIEYSQGCFQFKGHFSMLVNIFCSHAFSTIREIFSGDIFFIKSYWNQKTSLRQLNLKMVGLHFQRLFISRTFFHRTFQCQNFGFYFLKLFQRTFLPVTSTLLSIILSFCCSSTGLPTMERLK